MRRGGGSVFAKMLPVPLFRSKKIIIQDISIQYSTPTAGTVQYSTPTGGTVQYSIDVRSTFEARTRSLYALAYSARVSACICAKHIFVGALAPIIRYHWVIWDCFNESHWLIKRSKEFTHTLLLYIILFTSIFR